MSGYKALRQSAAWIDLSPRGKIRATGEDRKRLLHALTTNDVKSLNAGSGVYAFFLNEKGRILADVYIYDLGDSLFLDTEPETGAKVREHIDKYVIADDVTLTDETTEWAAIGLEGPASRTAATGLGVSVPDAQYGTREWGGGFAAHVASTGPEGIRLFLPVAELPGLLDRLSAAGIPQASAEDARAVRIENGMARYGEEITESHLVQETQVMHAVHFNKGCYLGQEIVERVRSRGQVHRLLAAVRFDTKTPPAPGAKLIANGEPAGAIASAAFSPEFDEAVGLAYVSVRALQEKPEMLVQGADPDIRAHIR